MTARDVVEVLEHLEAAAVAAVLDGGWGVDALLDDETRQHRDVDVVVADGAREPACVALAPLGFAHAPHVRPGLPARYVLRDAGRHQVDLHLVVYDERGNGWQQLGGGGWGLYPVEELAARGTVGGSPVRCISAPLQLRHHLGYAWGETDAHDMSRLAVRFGLPLPPGISRSRE